MKQNWPPRGPSVPLAKEGMAVHIRRFQTNPIRHSVGSQREAASVHFD